MKKERFIHVISLHSLRETYVRINLSLLQYLMHEGRNAIVPFLSTYDMTLFHIQ